MSDLEFGIRITVIGMGIVFGILILLWGLLTLAMRFEPAEAAGSAPAPVAPSWTDTVPAAGLVPVTRERVAGERPVVRIDGAEAVEPALLAAITVAILDHAEARRLQAAPAMRSYWPGSLLFASRWVSAGRTRQGQSWRRRSK